MSRFFNLTIIILIFVSGLLGPAFFAWPAEAVHFADGLLGRILLQTEKNGEAWYVYPLNGERYYLGRPAQAFGIMRQLSLGAKHDFIANTEIFPERLSGRILLDVEMNGEAYYIYPEDRKKYYLGRPADAFRIMRELGLGITNQDIAYVPIGDISAPAAVLPNGRFLIANVPFTAQAPFGDWSDQRQQDGCEEASALMAVRWARGEELSRDSALANILNASDYIADKYGEYRDVSLEDTIDWILGDYFGFKNARIIRGVSVEQMVGELSRGNLLLVPMNGQQMHNPHFTEPGPPRHMVVVRGFDQDRQVFITNDPGTRHGELYEYDYQVFYNAIRAYPTGYHELIEEVEKDMIVVEKEE